MASEIERLKLWAVLEEKGTDDQRSIVKKLADQASAILDRVIETFPTYTLHNSTHARNVAELMAELLGSRLTDLTALETAMLLLSSFWHDTGMVFMASERTSLESEPYWLQFLSEKPEAAVALEEASELSIEIAEWYCRWRHADRVYVHLDREHPKRLQWGHISFREALGELCRSHNLAVTEIKINDALQNNYLEEADLKFCAILLRIADILDFDNTRSPDAVYEMLGLERRASPREKESDVEWRKHLVSDGFRFPVIREYKYQLGFIAGPTHPAVEHDLRQFLDVIENELEQCRALLPFCSSRWQSFVLPGEISRDNIKSNGYKYGEYHFLLDQEQILNLLMGENLYQDRYVFIRELLQNAIDTSRYREYYERAHTNPDFESRPILISDWRDKEGRLWVRFDDFGMGMDERIIRDHLLKVGSSYYQTARFKAEVIRAQRLGAPNFVPISRYGIGLLSCFITCDRVEISTRHLNPEEGASIPIRLSLEGLHGFYTLQTGRLQPTPFPSENGEEPGYRWQIGTSVAVRVDPRKELTTFKLRPLLEEYLLSSPVPIRVNGELFGQDYGEFIERPWCEETVIALPSDEMAKLEELTSWTFSEPLKISFLPLDLTRHSPSAEFKGQMLTALLQPSQEWSLFLKDLEPIGEVILAPSYSYESHQSFDVALRTHPYKNRRRFVSQLKKKFSGCQRGHALLSILERIESAEPWSHESHSKATPSVFLETARKEGGVTLFQVTAHCSLSLTKCLKLLPERVRANIASVTNYHSLISHNGIRIPIYHRSGFSESYESPIKPRLNLCGPLSYGTISWGAIALADSLRPDVDVSRDSLRKMPLAAYSSALISLLGALASVKLYDFSRDAIARFTSVIDENPTTLGQLLDEKIFAASDWADAPVFQTPNGTLTLSEVKEQIVRGNDIEVFIPTATDVDENLLSFSDVCAATLAQTTLNLQVRLNENFRARLLGIPGRPREILSGQKFYPPLSFLPYVASLFCVRGYGANINHPLSKWLIEITPRLSEAYPGVFSELKSQLLQISATPEFWRPLEFRAEVNDILGRMMMLRREFHPPKTTSLDEEDVQPQSEGNTQVEED